MSKHNQFISALISFISLFIGLLESPSAHADDWHRRGNKQEWHCGHWVHDRHDGKLGWWWVVGSNWFFFDRPHTFVQTTKTIVVQQPQPVIVQPPQTVIVQPASPPAALALNPSPTPVVPFLYFCIGNGLHYPEVTECESGWTAVSVTTPPKQQDP